MLTEKIKIRVSAALAVLCLFAAALPAAAFSMEGFDPNSGDEAVIEWDTGDDQAEEYGDPRTYESPYGDKFFDGGEPYSTAEERETLRAPLDDDLCEPAAFYIDADEGFLTEEQKKKITASLRFFYDGTGVQPYLICTRDGLDDASSEDLLRQTYRELFGDDGGHFILLFSEEDGYARYDMRYYAGYEAGRVVTYDAAEVLMSYIDDCSRAGLTYEDTFCRSFEKCVDYVLYGEKIDVVYGYTAEEETTKKTGIDQTVPESVSGARKNNASDTEKTDLIAFIFVFAAALVLIFCIFMIAANVIRKRKNDER